MPRTILIHLNVEAPDDDPRSGDEIADAVLEKIERGLGLDEGALASGNTARVLTLSQSVMAAVEVCVPLAEEV